MIPAIRKVLYCTDLSESAAYVLSYAAAVAGRCGAGITVLHVLEDVPEGSKQLVTSAIGVKRWEEITRKNTQDILEILQKQVKAFQDKARTAKLYLSPR